MTLLGRLLSWLTLFSCILFICALPTSLVEDVKDNEVRNIKVKRAHDDINRPEENSRDSVSYYGNPTAIKRGTKLDNDQLGSGWDQDQSVFQTSDMPIIPSSLYTTDSDQFDDKSIAEYEKGYRYGTNKDKLDEALQNAVLKSELYGDPASINQYRYYGGAGEDNRRKRRNTQRMRLENRIKRDVELSPEDILTILTLWENEHQRSPNYRNRQRFDSPLDLDKDREEGYLDLNGQDEENWLDTPVYPHASTHANSLSPNFYYEKPVFDKHGQWGPVIDPKKKKFMVARKRNDPTRELRYINGPNINDYYTLSQLLGAQRDPNVPLYHRRVL